jgi:hypothetical protein
LKILSSMGKTGGYAVRFRLFGCEVKPQPSSLSARGVLGSGQE